MTFYFKRGAKDYAFAKCFKKINDINYIIHLAGQAGVRHSIVNPKLYIENI